MEFDWENTIRQQVNDFNRRLIASKGIMGYQEGGMPMPVSGLIPGPVNLATGDDTTIKAKRGEYVIPTEAVRAKGRGIAPNSQLSPEDELAIGKLVLDQEIMGLKQSMGDSQPVRNMGMGYLEGGYITDEEEQKKLGLTYPSTAGVSMDEGLTDSLSNTDTNRQVTSPTLPSTEIAKPVSTGLPDRNIVAYQGSGSPKYFDTADATFMNPQAVNGYAKPVTPTDSELKGLAQTGDSAGNKFFGAYQVLNQDYGQPNYQQGVPHADIAAQNEQNIREQQTGIIEDRPTAGIPAPARARVIDGADVADYGPEGVTHPYRPEPRFSVIGPNHIFDRQTNKFVGTEKESKATGHVVKDKKSSTGWSYMGDNGNIVATGAPDPYEGRFGFKPSGDTGGNDKKNVKEFKGWMGQLNTLVGKRATIEQGYIIDPSTGAKITVEDRGAALQSVDSQIAGVRNTMQTYFPKEYAAAFKKNSDPVPTPAPAAGLGADKKKRRPLSSFGG